MAILDDIKTTLRISSTAYDTEIEDLIVAAKDDLEYSGLYSVDDTDPLTKRAITTYVKAQFGYEEKAEMFMKSYDMMKAKLGLSLDHSYFKVTINAGEQCKITFDGITKESNDSGTAVFYTRAKNHVPYSYGSTSGYLDVKEDTTVGG